MSDVHDNQAAGRYELVVDGHTAWADYRRAPGQLIIDHVEAPVELRGSGASGRLMDGVALAARQAGEKIVPHCSYAAAWLQRSASNRDLIA